MEIKATASCRNSFALRVACLPNGEERLYYSPAQHAAKALCTTWEVCEHPVEYSRLVVIRDIWFGSAEAGLGRTGRVYASPKPLPGVPGTYTDGTVGSNS